MRGRRPLAVLSLNTCLLPTHLRWIFRAHRGVESLRAATARIAHALAAADAASPVDVLHLQEVFVPASLDELAAALRPLGFVHASAHARCGLATLSKHALTPLELRESPRPPFTPKGWAALLVRAPGLGAEVHVNCHFASEIDGSHTARLAQARDVGDWVRAHSLAQAARAGRAAGAAIVERVLVVGDLNEPDGAGAAQLLSLIHI